MLSNPANRHRWFIVVSIVVALVVVSLGMALNRALSSPPRFRASSLVLITPTSSTSGVLAQSFQARALQSMPGVHLEQRGSPGLVEVVAYATNAAEAQTNANQAPSLLARAAMETLGGGVRVSQVRQAFRARRTSIFHP